MAGFPGVRGALDYTGFMPGPGDQNPTRRGGGTEVFLFFRPLSVSLCLRGESSKWAVGRSLALAMLCTALSMAAFPQQPAQTAPAATPEALTAKANAGDANAAFA